MSTFTLAISCLTTSNLPGFMDLTFQVPMQYCSLEHWTLLLSPVTSTAGYCFGFGSIPSFFLELFRHWSPVAYWAPTDLNSITFDVFPHFLISSSFDGHFGSFHILAIVNSAAMNMEGLKFLWVSTFDSFGYIPWHRIAGSYGNSIFNFLRNFHTFPTVAAQIYISTNSAQEFQFFTSSPTFLIFWSFWQWLS